MRCLCILIIFVECKSPSMVTFSFGLHRDNVCNCILLPALAEHRESTSRHLSKDYHWRKAIPKGTLIKDEIFDLKYGFSKGKPYFLISVHPVSLSDVYMLKKYVNKVPVCAYDEAQGFSAVCFHKSNEYLYQYIEKSIDHSTSFL